MAVSNSLVHRITNHFVKSMSAFSITKDWKVHKICPVFKAGDRSLTKNYCSISLSCLLSKILKADVFLGLKITCKQYEFMNIDPLSLSAACNEVYYHSIPKTMQI